MFSENKKTKSAGSVTSQQNRIAQGTKIVGNIVAEGGFRIDGEIDGEVNTKEKVVIGPKGKISGTLICKNADIEGEFTGKLQVAELLTLKSTAVVSGEVVTAKLHVDQDAIFNVTCEMRSGGVKELNAGERKSEKTA